MLSLECFTIGVLGVVYCVFCSVLCVVRCVLCVAYCMLRFACPCLELCAWRIVCCVLCSVCSLLRVVCCDVFACCIGCGADIAAGDDTVCGVFVCLGVGVGGHVLVMALVLVSAAE